MLYDDSPDYSAYSDSELQNLLESAETDSEACLAILVEMQRRSGEEFDESIYDLEVDVGSEEPFVAPALPYRASGKILWPSITAICILLVLILFYNVLNALGGFDSKLYFLMGGVSFAVLSQAFLISGIREVVNKKTVADYKVLSFPYLLNALIWGAGCIYAVYSLVRTIIAFQDAGLGIAFYISIPSLVLAALAMFQFIAFVLLSKELS